MAKEKHISPQQLKHETFVETIKQEHLGTIVQDNQLQYANLVNTLRAIPQVLDGFKPVNRRIFFGIKESSLLGRNVKSARVVGDVIGKYHPHGDMAVYEAMVDMVQPFKNRFPLFVGQGNWGTIEGDSQAAMRYTESKVPNDMADILFRNIEKNVITWSPNFDETLREPLTLPILYPYALLNGSFGIGYGGISTNIPSYNIKDLTNFYIYLLENKFWKEDFNVEEHKEKILNIIPSVDFPTGTNIYFDGETKQEDMIFKPDFSIRMRASYTINYDENTITFFNIPYGVKAGKIKEQAAEAALSYYVDKNNKQIPKDPTEILNISENIDIETYSMIGDIEHFKNDAKLTFTFKRNAQLDLELIKCFKYTSLDLAFSARMMFIDRYSCPKMFSLYEQTIEFLKFRLHVAYKSYLADIKKIEDNIHLLNGLKIVVSDLDKFIQILKVTDDDKVYATLKDSFLVDDIQIDYLLNIPLKKISKNSVESLISEINDKLTKCESLKTLISSKDCLYNDVLNDYKEILKSNLLKGPKVVRFTKIIEANKNISKEDLIEDKEIIIMYMEDDTIAFVDKSKFKIKKRGTKTTNNKINSDFELQLKISENCYLKDDLLLMTNKGRVFKIKAFNFTDTFRYIGNVLNIDKEEKIISILKYNDSNEYYSISTKLGKIKGLKNSLFANITSNRGITAINLEDKDEVISFTTYKKCENEYVIVFSNTGKLLKYSSDEIPVLNGGNTKGVRNVNLKTDEKVIKTIIYVENDETVLIGVSNIGRGKKVLAKKITTKKRAGASMVYFNNNAQNGVLIGADIFNNQDTEILMLLNEVADVSFIKIKNFRAINRTSKGAVKLLNLNENEKIKLCKKTYLEDLSDTQAEIVLDEFENTHVEVETDDKEDGEE